MNANIDYPLENDSARKDITTRNDIERLVDAFYEKIKADELLGHFFMSVNWEKHLPTMYLFWENVLFFKGGYSGNPIRSHTQLHQHKPLNAAHFERWVQLFRATVDELFSGLQADTIKQRAENIATVMLLKIIQ